MVRQLLLGFKRRAGGSVGFVCLSLLVALVLATPFNASAVPLFSEDTLKSIGIGNSQACVDSGDPGCYTNWFELADIDQDGDFDLLMANGGSLFAPGNQEAAVVYLNDGKGAFFNATNASFGGPPSQVRQIAVGDINGDGNLDLYQPGAYGTDADMLWVQIAPRVFVDQAATLLPQPIAPSVGSHAASTHFGDLDDDGDLDLVVADWGDASAGAVSRLILYSNDGHGRFTLTETQKDAVDASDHFPATISATPSSPYYGSRPTDLDFVDVDGDFDLDILINHREGYSRIFLNDGRGYFSDGTGFTGTLPAEITANYAPKRGPYANNQEACDLDHDGDLDLVLDNAGKAPEGSAPGMNVTQLLLNDGHGVFLDQTRARIVDEPAALDGAAKCADVNGDGHYDIVIGSRSHSSEKVLLNDGTGRFTYEPDALPQFTDMTLAVDLGDLNGDGKLDLVTGQGEGTLTTANAATLRNNRVYYGRAADITPPTFRALETPRGVVSAPLVFHVAVQDSATNQAGQMATVTVPYTINGLTKQAKVTFMGGDLFRVTIPPQVEGTVVSYAPTAVDRAKLTSKLSKVLYVGTPPVVIGAGGAGGAGEADAGEGGAIADGGRTGTTSGGGGRLELGSSEGGASTAAPSAGSAGRPPGGKAGGMNEGGAPQTGGEAGASDTPASAPSSSGDDGCSCALVPANGNRGLLGLGLALSLLGLARHRRRPRRGP
ncbi:MAG TPA: VCBS repeat-containing protein [Polyangiaceae bacterium]|nr:VCBS repeat-containing protein [Polyangiaceae bacterium]